MKKIIYLFLTLLIVSCSSDDSSDDGCDDDGGNLAIGQSYQGGIIYYIFQCEDTGYVAGEQHGLIAATENQSEETKWDNGFYIVTGATGTAIGTGLANTNAIIAAQGSGIYAASKARDYNGGGYTDWFLPSKGELNQLYENKTAIGGLPDDIYWSSTEYSKDGVWFHNFTNGVQHVYGKNRTEAVRAVRVF